MSSFGYAHLAERVLAGATSELLDAPLDRLQDEDADEDALELLRSACEQGEADTLRALLREGRLERFIDSTCTAGEEERLCAQLARWAERPPSPLDDPERLVAELVPPEGRDQLGRWAREHGVTEQLAALEALYPSGGRDEAGLLSRREQDAALRAGLSLAAQSALAGPRRAALWARKPTPLLRALGERLSALLGDTPLESLVSLRFDARRPVRIDAARSRALGELHGRGGHAHVAIVLSGYEQRALTAECSCGAPACLHGKALAARLYDACVAADDRLHPELVAFCRVPSWRRFLEAADGHAETEARPAGLRFRLRQAADGGLELAVLAAKDGRPTAAKALLRSPRAPEDVPVLEALAQRAQRSKALWERVDLGLLGHLVEHPRLELDDTGRALSVHEERAELSLEELPEGLRPSLKLRGQPLIGAPESAAQRFVWQLDPATSQLFFAELSPALVRFWAALGDFRGVLPKESYAGLGRLLAGLRTVADVALPKALLGYERPAPRTLTLYVSRAPTEGLFCSLSMSPLPLGAPWPPGRGPELVHGLVDGVETHTRRDLPWEREAAARIEAALGLSAAQRTGPHAYYVADEQAALCLLDAAARHHHELEVAWAEPARALVSAGTLRPGQLAIRLFRKGDWFGLSGRRRGADAADLPLATLFEAVRRGERYVKIDGERYAEIAAELRERLLRVEPMVQLTKAELSLAQSAVPQVVLALGGDEVELDPEARALVAAEALRDPGELSLPPTLVPRDYQREGIGFLVQRSRWASGVCLADEMGLGKTVQTIALLWLRRALGPQLVIAPTSVIGNWESELARFAPDLRVISYGGAARRELLAELGPAVVLVASYDVILRDRTALAGHGFATQVIDEAQFVKNARTERFRAVAAVQADFRVALSGTPIENRTGDLFSLFALIAPGLLGSWQRFRARFAVPIERYDDRERARMLRELVAPFVLRREKSAVARELPERTEVVHRIELTAPERDLYDAAARAAREALDLRGRSDRVPRLKVLAELTRLRQLACHPRLVLGADATASSKLRALLALLDDLLPRGHRALLFSQFTRHLDLVREALDARGVTSLTLTGETSLGERKARVDAFQAGRAPVFLISLRAGGAGLNLTAADYVIHLDPWWNPAAEDQASDRAHRIGQLRPVTVVKLVAEDTIEEKVLRLHGHKRRLFAQLFDEQAQLSGPEESELFEELFRDAQARTR